MNTKNFKKAKLIALIVFQLILTYGAIQVTRQCVKCHQMSETELFLMIPENLINKFKECN